MGSRNLPWRVRAEDVGSGVAIGRRRNIIQIPIMGINIRSIEEQQVLVT